MRTATFIPTPAPARQFETWEAAIWFALFQFRSRRHKSAVRRVPARVATAGDVWEVRPA